MLFLPADYTLSTSCMVVVTDTSCAMVVTLTRMGRKDTASYVSIVQNTKHTSCASRSPLIGLLVIYDSTSGKERLGANRHFALPPVVD